MLCHPDLLIRAAKLFPELGDPNIGCPDEFPVHRSQFDPLFSGSSTADRIICANPANIDVASAPRCEVSAAAGAAAYQYLTAAADMAMHKVVDAVCTAPLNKAALHAAGHDFPGHTEILAQQCGVDRFAMMLHLPESRLAHLRQAIMPYSTDAKPCIRHGLSVAHVTLHNSIASVPQRLTTEGVTEKIRLLHDFLARIGCPRRAIGVCALNPHGGEDGLFGDEESRIISPAVTACVQDAINVAGPLPVDTLMRRAVCGEFDGVVAMYHDQGHIPIKLLGFDAAINITLGIPIIRTSPTHGTAFDRAWNPQTPADPSGMIEAILMAARLCRNAL